MSEMIEWVAKAMRDAQPDTESFEEFVQLAARSILKAMRELPSDPGPRYDAGEYSRRTQEAMIDDALE